MKKNLFAIMALLVCAFVACNKNEIEITTEPAGTVEMTVHAGDAATKTALSGSSIIWSGTEKLKVVETVTGGTDNNKSYAKTSSAGVSSDAGATMNFDVTLDTHSGATSFQYAAFYPSSAYNAVTSMSNVAVNTPYEQSPTADSFDPAADLLISQVSAASASQPTNINMAFARKIAIGKMTVKNLGTSDDITSVVFSAKQGSTDVVLAGRSKIDFTTSTVSYGSNLQNKTLTMDFSGDGVKMNTSEGAPVYFACYPFELNVANEGQFTVVVETATHRYTRTVTLTGAQTLELTPGDVARFSVNMSGVEGVTKAVSMHYAEFTKADAYGAGVTSGTYATFDIEKGTSDKWAGKVNYTNGGFGIRNSASTNDSYVKLPDFAEKIMTVTVELSQAFAHNNDPAIDTYLSLETAANLYSKSIASLDQVDDQMTYVFNVSANNVKTAYFRATGAAVYVKKISVTTNKADTRTQLSAPTGVTAALDGTNDIVVSWTKAANAIGYEVVCTPTSGDPVVAEVGDVATYTFEGLANTTTYTITISSIPNYYTHTKSTAATSTPATVTTTKGASYVLNAVKAAGNNAYNSTYDVTINGKGWKAPGNQNFEGYWRIGGKKDTKTPANSLSATDRVIYSKEVITTDDISQVVISTGGISRTDVTIHSTKLEVYDTAAHAAAGGTEGRIAILTNTDSDWAVSTNKNISFDKADLTSWASRFFRITFNMTNTSTTNGGVDFKKAEFFE